MNNRPTLLLGLIIRGVPPLLLRFDAPLVSNCANSRWSTISMISMPSVILFLVFSRLALDLNCSLCCFEPQRLWIFFAAEDVLMP